MNPTLATESKWINNGDFGLSITKTDTVLLTQHRRYIKLEDTIEVKVELETELNSFGFKYDFDYWLLMISALFSI